MTILGEEDPGVVQGRDLLGELLRTDGCMHAFRYPHAFPTSSAGAH